MIPCLQWMACCPSDAVAAKLNTPTLRRLDLARRITLYAILILSLTSFVLLALGVAQRVHPLLGVAALGGTLLLGIIHGILIHVQQKHSPQPLNELYAEVPPTN